VYLKILRNNKNLLIYFAHKLKATVTNSAIIKLAVPISLALLISQVSFLTNTAFLGRLGEKELGINGITGIFYLILAMIGYGLSSGMQVQMARRSGEGDKQGLAAVFSNGIMLSIVFALGLMLLALWVAPIIFGLSLHKEENVFLSVDFLYIRVWGLPFLMLTQLFNAFYISIHKSRFLIYGSLVATAVNIFGDYALIFGKFGFQPMGLRGAAVAAILSEISYLLVMMGLFYANKFKTEYPLHLRQFNFQMSQRTLKVAAPLIVQFLFSIGGWQVFFIYIEHLGTRELAASQILRSIFGIVGVGTWAFATASNTMVSNIIGQGRQREVVWLIRKIAKLSFIFACITCVLLIGFSEQFLSMYRNDPALVSFATPSLRVIVLATLIMSISTVVFNGVVGTGKTMVNLSMEVACVLAYLVYCYIIIERMHSPLWLCWGSEFVYWISLLLASSLYMLSGRWKGKEI
jgi:putative MATE family efflux protein